MYQLFRFQISDSGKIINISAGQIRLTTITFQIVAWTDLWFCWREHLLLMSCLLQILKEFYACCHWREARLLMVKETNCWKSLSNGSFVRVLDQNRSERKFFRSRTDRMSAETLYSSLKIRSAGRPLTGSVVVNLLKFSDLKPTIYLGSI
ncbi:hypothetical protein O6H91_Y274800 [Diphasiastrum complanatum]|nr:hypothetical protein O6H91_Y274800 [Diphasiastrum complanatum]